MTFARIMVPTDFSPFARFALDEAIGLARETGARIDLVHSVFIPNLYELDGLDIERRLERSARERLLPMLEEVERKGIEASMHVVLERAAVGIRALAEKLESDCIVMGTRGGAGVAHVILGSTTERTLRIAPCPVLTVGESTGERARLPRKILVPIDFSKASEHAAATAQRLLREQPDGEVVLLHVFYRPATTGAYALSSDFETVRARLIEELEGVADVFCDEGLSAKVHVEEASSVAKAITRVAATEDCDWIVLGTHGRSGFTHLALGSIAEHVVRQAVRPTLTVKPPD